MLALPLLVLLAAPEPTPQAVVDAIAEEGCPRLFGLLTPQFQQAAPAATWPGWCRSVGRLEALTPHDTKRGWQTFRAKSVRGAVLFSVAFDAQQRVAGLKISAAPVEVPATATTAELLEALRGRTPALAAWVGRPGEPLTRAAVGVRKRGDPTKATIDDRWHLGSDTKAMTATLAALLVEEKKLAWTSTVGTALPDAKSLVAYRDVTLEELLTHRSGLPANLTDWPLLNPLGSMASRRASVARAALQLPAGKRGAYLYSNLGYVVAGAMIERALGVSWEEALRARVFKPLGMTGCGFGAPATVGTLDAPWAHRQVNGEPQPVEPGPASDNRPELGPAGTVHCTLEDWARFVGFHLRGARGEKTALLSPASFVKLHTPPPGSSYAMGWLVRGTGADRRLGHDGSNTLFYASALLAPEQNLFMLVAANAGDEAAQAAVTQTVAALEAKYACVAPCNIAK